jgi:cytochrome d ubiquinol oxidase subunit I
VSDLGYALLLKRYDPNVVDATDAEITQAAQDTVPAVATLFWSFRVMVGLGFGFIALFAAAFWLAARRRLDQRRWFLWVSALCLPLPWISCELGWVVAEYGRQPWAIEGVLPTYLANSSVAAGDVWFSLIGFIVFYTTLAIIDLYLILRTIRLGPDVVGDDSGPDRRHAIAQPVQ